MGGREPAAADPVQDENLAGTVQQAERRRWCYPAFQSNQAAFDTRGRTWPDAKYREDRDQVAFHGRLRSQLVLLAGAGLMIRSVLNLYAAPIGVDTVSVLTMRINPRRPARRAPARSS